MAKTIKRLHQIVICFACFLANGIIFGFLNSYGFVYQYIIDSNEYGFENIATIASLLGSLKLCVLFVFGIFSNIIIRKLGYQKATLMGASISLASLLVCSYSPNVKMLFLTYGVLHSIGSSLLFISSLSIIFYHFKKRVGLATGISTLGSPTFTMIFPFFLRNYIENYGIHSYFALEGIIYSSLLFCAVIWTVKSESNIHLNANGEEKVIFHPTSSLDQKIEISKPSRWNIFKSSYLKILQNRKYVIWLFAMKLVFFSCPIPFIFTVSNIV
ncbi:hypothetical protein A3Q56_03056 [Intoshia linei]|uniref:Major facilitator superfamily (MFS) profile domain-containing protein n=1 Tax=Intoshia linei TaxID=1819745 RepID=A0A177B4Y8_9BILA|nr:hypothetical protein A3Q56_03056 [Intoshia linei]